jgi:aminoglycoside phosphotransferase (APT) family kinase protein
MVREAGVTASEPVSCFRIAEGIDSQVYAARFADSSPGLIVKIQRAEEDLDQEAWALNAAAKVGVPVPEVVHIGTLTYESQPVRYLIETEVRGRSLSTRVSTLTSAERQAAFEQIGVVLARLHQLEVGGFWKRQTTGQWDFPTWEAVMASTLKDRKAEWRELQPAGFTAAQAEQVFAGIARYATEFPCATPVLCHGDLLPEHVYFDDTGRVSAVIDFGMYSGGDPVGDLAVIRMAVDPVDFDAVLRGYSPGAALDPSFQLHLHLALLTTQVGYLLHHMRLPDHPDVAGYAAGLRSTLDWLERHG